MMLPSHDPEMLPDGYGIDLKSEAVERRNIARAKYTILRNGLLLPVTNLFDSDGEEIQNPMHAARVVVYNASRPDGDLWEVYEIDPGELWSRHEREEVPQDAHR